MDYGKGSFYANPLTDDLLETMLDRRRPRGGRMSEEYSDGEDEISLSESYHDESIDVVKTEDELRELAFSNPAFFAPNVWPTEHLPDIESTFKNVGSLIHEVGIMVAKCCDSYVSSLVR